MAADDVIHRYTSGQHGLATPAQLRRAGVPKWVIANRIRRGSLVPLSDRVVRLAGSPDTPHQRAMAAVLDAGASSAVARASAFALWGLPGFELEPVHVVRPRARRGIDSVVGPAHLTRDLRTEHVAELYGIPVTSPARTLVDMAAELHPERLARLCDQAWARRLLSGPALHEVVGELAGRGRRGSAALKALLAERPIDYRPPESNLEARVAEILCSGGEAPLERQVDVGDGDDWLGRVDLLDRSLRIVVEVQSDLFHSSVTARARDRERRARLEAAGWLVVEIREFDVWHRPDRVVLAVRRARNQVRKAGLAS